MDNTNTNTHILSKRSRQKAKAIQQPCETRLRAKSICTHSRGEIRTGFPAHQRGRVASVRAPFCFRVESWQIYRKKKEEKTVGLPPIHLWEHTLPSRMSVADR